LEARKTALLSLVLLVAVLAVAFIAIGSMGTW